MNVNPLKKTPLNPWHRAHGARMVDFGGWEMPLHYKAGILQEHLATRKSGGLFDISHMGRFRILGENRVRFLQHVLSSNVEALEPWQAQYTLIPSESGAAIDDAYLYRFGQQDYLLVVNAANAVRDWAHFEEQRDHFPGVALEDHTERTAMFAFQGPWSGRVLAGLIQSGDMPETFRNRLSQLVLWGTNVLAARTGYTGEPIGFELFVPAEKAEEIWSKLCEAGSDRGIVPVGLGARDTLRLEAGLPLYGHELGLDPEGRPMPALAFPAAGIAVSFSPRKGDYLGREALGGQLEQVQRVRARSGKPSGIVARQIQPLAVLDQGVARRGDEVFLGGQKVGMVTSGTVAPYWEFAGEGAALEIGEASGRRAIALAYLDAALLPEQGVEIVVRGRRLQGRIVRWHGRSDAPPYFRPVLAGREKAVAGPAAGKAVEPVALVLRKSLENHRWRQDRSINLIPSEMTPSPLVRLLQVSDPVGRYAEHKEVLALGREVFYYQGTDFIAWVEERVAAQMREFLGCGLVETRVLSGQMANMAVFSALVDYTNRLDRRREPQRLSLVMNNHLARGGHLSAQPMGALRDYVARDPVTEQYAVVAFPACKDNPYKIDVARTADLLERLNPELLIFGRSLVLHPEPVGEIKKLLAGKRQPPILMYDMAHVLGLVGPHFQEPFREGADLVTASTHKTFFGPQRGIIAAAIAEDSPQHELWNAIRRRTFPGMVSNHHLGTLLGLLVAAMEMNAFKDDYQRQVIANAKAFARALADEGLDVEGGGAVDFTESHQVIVRVGYAKGCQVARDLEQSNVIVNFQAIPGDESFTSSSGLRLGVAEMTRFGMKEGDFAALAPLLAHAIKTGSNVANEVAAFREPFRSMHYCFDGEAVEPLKRQLLETF